MQRLFFGVFFGVLISLSANPQKVQQNEKRIATLEKQIQALQAEVAALKRENSRLQPKKPQGKLKPVDLSLLLFQLDALTPAYLAAETTAQKSLAHKQLVEKSKVLTSGYEYLAKHTVTNVKYDNGYG